MIVRMATKQGLRWPSRSSRTTAARPTASRPTSSTCGSSGSRASTSTTRSRSPRPTGRPLLALPGDPGARADANVSRARRRASPASTRTTSLTFGADALAPLCARAHKAGLAVRTVGRPRLRRAPRDRRHASPGRATRGATYDAMWRAAIQAGADRSHDHELQRVARRHADRAGHDPAAAPAHLRRPRRPRRLSESLIRAMRAPTACTASAPRGPTSRARRTGRRSTGPASPRPRRRTGPGKPLHRGGKRRFGPNVGR